MSESAPQAQRGMSAADTERLAVRAPFHLEATVRILQRRPANLIDVWEEQRYRRTLRIGGRPRMIEVVNRGTLDAPEVMLAIAGGDSFSGEDVETREKAEAVRITREILGLDLDPHAPQRRAEAEPALRATAAALRGMRPPRYPELFETFANVIPFQQVSLQAGMSVVAKLIQRFGEAITIDGQPRPLFPSAAAVADARLDSLRRCGMSARKSQALRSIARAIAAGDLTSASIAALSSAEAMERLVELPGIGPWSAALVLLRGFRRLELFPQADSGAEGSLAALLELPSRPHLARVVERFGDCRGYLYFYALASRLLAAELIHPAAAAA